MTDVIEVDAIERKDAARDEVRDGIFESVSEAIAAEAQADQRRAAYAASLPATKQFEDAYAQQAAENGLPGFRNLRERAMKKFVQLGFPTSKHEDWHFTSVAAIAEGEWRPLTTSSTDVPAEIIRELSFGRDWHTMVFVNGRFSEGLSTIGHVTPGEERRSTSRHSHASQAIEGVSVSTLRASDDDRIGSIASFEDSAFTALNTALASDGAVIVVDANVEVERPIHLVFVSDGNAAKGVSHPRNLIVLRRHAKATVIESYVSTGDATYFTNAVTEVDLADGATLTHTKIQRESRRAFHVGTIETRQARDSHYVSFSFATGAALSRTNIYTLLDGEGCGSTLNGLYLGDGDQTIDHQTRIEHAKANCYSREIYKGVLDDSAHGVFNGKVYVRPQAQKTDGKQTNNVMLLSERAHVDAKPQLEIFADDVKCTHGATVGRLDEMSLFYMKSRGVGREMARRLLTYAFAADVLETIENEAIRVGLEEMVLKRFTEK